MKRIKSMLAVLALIGASLFVVTATAGNAQASYNPCSGYRATGLQAGYFQQPSTAQFEGVSGLVTAPGTTFCSPDSANQNFTSWYTMIASGQSWAQSGIATAPWLSSVGGVSCSSKMWTWAEQEQGYPTYAPVNVYGACESSGSFAARSLYNPANQRMESSINGVNLIVSVYNVYSWWPAQPWEVEYMDETHFNSSDMMGTPSVHADDNDMGIQRYSDDVLVTSCGNATLGIYLPPSSNRFTTGSTHCDHVYAYTVRTGP